MSIENGFRIDFDYIADYSGPGGEVTLPLSARVVGEKAFYNNKTITAVTIPSNINHIWDKAFQNCISLESVVMGGTHLTICAKAFAGCKKLKNITFPESAIVDCTAFDGTPWLNAGETRVIARPRSDLLYRYFDKGEEEYTVPANIGEVNGLAFSACNTLKTVIVQGGTMLKERALEGAETVQKVISYQKDFPCNILGLSKTYNAMIPLVMPNVNLPAKITKPKEPYAMMLAMGYVLMPDVYNAKKAERYQAFVAENKAQLVELAAQYVLEEVLEKLGGRKESEPTEDVYELPEKLTLAQAEEQFLFSAKKTGVKILISRSKEKVVDVPRMIGKTAVALFDKEAFPEGTVVRCSADAFPKLPDSAKLETIKAYMAGSVSFPQEQKVAMDQYMQSIEAAIAAVNAQDVELLATLLNKKKPTVPQLQKLKELAEQAIPVRAWLLEYENNVMRKEVAAEKATKETEVQTELAQLADSAELQKKDWKWSKGKDGLRIKRYVGTECNLLIPASVDGVSVTALDYGLFYKSKTQQWRSQELESVTVPEGLLEIDDYTFFNCGALVRVEIPASVVKIHPGAFRGCPKLTFYAPAGSYAETYAKENNIPFEAI